MIIAYFFATVSLVCSFVISFVTRFPKITCSFFSQLIKILNDKETKPSPGEEKLAALTADMRYDGSSSF